MASNSNAVRARISAMFPGDDPAMKAIRHKCYATPGLLDGDPTDDQIRAAAEAPAQKSEVPANPSADAPLVGEVLTAEQEAALVKKHAVEIAAKAVPVVIETAEDYERASLGFAQIQRLRADNEAKRVKLKKPILEAGRVLDAEFKEVDAILAKEQARFETSMIAFKAAERKKLREQEADRQAALAAETARLQAEANAALANLQQVRQAEASLSALPEDDYDDAPAVSPVAAATVQAQDALRAVAMAPQRLATLLPEVAAPVTATGSKTSYPWVVEVTDPGQVARAYCTPDQSLLNALGKRLKAELHDDITKINAADYPGLRIYETTRIGGR